MRKKTAVFWIIATLSVPHIVRPQSPAIVESALAKLRVSDLEGRVEAYDELFPRGGFEAHSGREKLTALLRAHPDKAERIKTGLIDALVWAAGYRDRVENQGEQLSETFSEHFAGLISVVGPLRDPRAIKGLIAALDTGGMAGDYLEDLCPAVVDPLVERYRGPEVYWQGVQLDKRAQAIGALGGCFARVAAMKTDPDAYRKARAVVLGALDDHDPTVRNTSVFALSPLRNDPEVRAKLVQVAAKDPYLHRSQLTKEPPTFSIRAEAARVLEPVHEDSLFFLMRQSETGECRVQRATDPPFGEQLIGPFNSESRAQYSMCKQYQPGTNNPLLCGRIQPEGSCGTNAAKGGFRD